MPEGKVKPEPDPRKAILSMASIDFLRVNFYQNPGHIVHPVRGFRNHVLRDEKA
jgi:hypothetical protein